MSILTFSDLIANPTTSKHKTVQILLGEALTGSWVQEAGPNTDVWALPYLQETIALNTGDNSIIIKRITQVDADGEILTRVASIVACQADTTSFFHDIANSKIYCNTSGIAAATTAPDTVYLVGYFNIFFATSSIVLSSQFPKVGNFTTDTEYTATNQYYEPYIKNIAGVKQSSQNIMSGYSQTGTATITLNNSDGFFDVILDKYIWQNKLVAIRLGGEDLPFSEYSIVFVGLITEKQWGRNEVKLKAQSKMQSLLRTLPESIFGTTAYPNLNEKFNGASIPIVYGTFNARTAPYAIPIDESYGTDKVQYKLASHAIKSLDGVRADYGGASGLETLTLDNTLASVNTYGSVDLTLATFLVRFTASGYKAGTTKVKATLTGTKKADGSLMTKGSDIVKDLLVTYLGFNGTTELSATPFTTSNADSNGALAIHLSKPTRTNQIIDKICSSDLAYFYIDTSGLFRYVVWVPGKTVNLTVYDKTDLFEFETFYPASEQYQKINVGFLEDADGNYVYTTQSRNATKYLYGNEKQKNIETYLTSKSNAIVLAQRLVILHQPPFLQVKGKTKYQFANKNIGDKVELTVTRAPDSGGSGFVNKALEITSLTHNLEDSSITFEMDDLKGIGLNVGVWATSDVPQYLSASAAQKNAAGFWSDSAGLINPSDNSTRNLSLWW